MNLNLIKAADARMRYAADRDYQLYQIIRSNPGHTTKELQELSGTNETTIRQRLRNLATLKFIYSQKEHADDSKRQIWKYYPMKSGRYRHEWSRAVSSSAECQIRDLAQVQAYLAAHPNATLFDVALECHMGNLQAARLMKLCRNES